MGTAHFELIVVPDGAPRTKPKALNYALPTARGTHIVVFDAEDKPEPDQLRRAATLFDADPRIACIQAELVIENAATNGLTALFAAEYSALFGVMLPALANWQLPMPLGGTSNHFQTAVLREIGGWDAFNVTEDADIGIRLSRLGRNCLTMPSRTYEEIPTTVTTWLHQRTRWMKGWMQTLLVHNRHPRKTLQDMGWRNFFAFQIYVGSVIITPPLHTLFLIAFTLRFGLTGTLLEPPENQLVFLQYFLLFAGHLSAIALSVLGMYRLTENRPDSRPPSTKSLMKYQWLLPLYWALLGIAVLKAGWELIHKPFYWAKTIHKRNYVTHEYADAPVADDAQQPRRERERSTIS